MICWMPGENPRQARFIDDDGIVHFADGSQLRYMLPIGDARFYEKLYAQNRDIGMAEAHRRCMDGSIGRPK